MIVSRGRDTRPVPQGINPPAYTFTNPLNRNLLIELVIYLLWLSNTVRIQQQPQGQFTVTIPRALAQALDIGKGDRAEWKVRDGDLVLKLLR